MNITLETIRSFLKEFHPQTVEKRNLVHAGVLIAMFHKDNDLQVIFTQRTHEVEHHKGQVSFPGGVKEESDATIIETALREAYEEIGLSRTVVEVLGVLNDFTTPSGFIITPIVGYLSTVPLFHLNKVEVLEVFHVPLSFFMHNERIEQINRDGRNTNIYFYRYGNHEIWGATAAILRLFLQSVSEWLKTKKAL